MDIPFTVIIGALIVAVILAVAWKTGLLTQLLTGADNQTHDLGRWSWAVSMATVIGHSVYAAYQHLAVDLVQLASALAAVAAAHGIAIGIKKDTEPGGRP